MKSGVRGLKALTFDVFGATLDWHGSIVREGAIWAREKGLNVDWSRSAEYWRAGYKPPQKKSAAAP